MSIRVLLVDDEPALLEITTIYLQRENGFSIETAQSGGSALELLETDSFDAIVSDYEMPGMNGLELLSSIRDRGISMPFIIFTGKGREDVVIEALNRGADFYLQKGGDPTSQFAELRSKIIHAVEKRRAEQNAQTAHEELKKAYTILGEQNQRLEESEAKFRNLANSTSVAILLYQDDQWIYANPAAERMCGYSAEEICTMKFWEFVAPEFQEVVKERGQLREMGEKAPKTYEFKILTKTGEEVWVHLVGSTTEYQGRLAGLISVIDISERKNMEDALRLANHKLSLLSRITRHDIQNDIMDAKGHLELYEAVYPESVTPYLMNVEKAITRIEREIEFTGKYETLGTSPPGWQGVREVTEDSFSQMNIPEDIQTEIDISPVEIYADQLLTLAISNIVRNALVHAKGLSKITAATHETSEGELCITIEDDGTGVQNENKGAILQQTYNRRSGHGLYLVRDILELTGITIRETGTPGKGARFELIVPAGRWRYGTEESP